MFFGCITSVTFILKDILSSRIGELGQLVDLRVNNGELSASPLHFAWARFTRKVTK
jgi:hypothetical protein